MPLKLLITKDGSHTIEGEDGVTYHSTFGAIGEYQPVFEQIHSCEWGKPVALHPAFTFLKVRADLRNYTLQSQADLVFFDAFDPVTQPELWTAAIFSRLYRELAPGALLVTYSCKGEVRRTLSSIGFETEKLPGPAGKREMLRARIPLMQN